MSTALFTCRGSGFKCGFRRVYRICYQSLSKPGVAEKWDELKRSFKHPTPFSPPDSAMPFSKPL
jgi:hypothetical protein